MYNLIFLFILSISLNSFAGSYFQGTPAFLYTQGTSVATTSGATTLTKDSNEHQFFTGTLGQEVVLPNATTLQNHRKFLIANRSTGDLILKYNDGSVLTTLNGDSEAVLILKSNATTNGTWDLSNSANRSLSNLVSPTSVNKSILPASGADISLGDQTNPWPNIIAQGISSTLQFGLRDTSLNPLLNLFAINDNEGIYGPMIRGPYLGSIASYPRFGLIGRVDGQNNANNTAALVLQTGNKTNGSGSSGKIQLRTGTSVAGSRGEIEAFASRLVLNNIRISSMAEPVDVSDASTKFYVDSAITSVSGSGANKTLSNLDSPTSVNQDLILQNKKISGLAVPTAISDATTKDYVDSLVSASSANRTLSNLQGPTAINQDLVMQNNKVTGLGAPTIASDAVTKAYVDSAISSVSGGTGSVTSISFSAPSNFQVSGSPITTSGIISLSYSSYPVKSVVIGPPSGVSAPPSLRVLTENDLPQISLASGVYGTLSVISGGTGLSSYTTGDLLYANGTNSLTQLAIGSAGQVLTVSNGIPSWQNAAGGSTLLTPNTVSVNTGSTVATNINVVNANAGGGSFVLTLPSAASVSSNQTMTIVKTDTTLNPVTLSGGVTGKGLYTPNEQWTFQSNGTSWINLSHGAKYSWQPTIISVGAATTSPNAGTYTENRYTCERSGKYLSCNVSYYGTGAGGTAGSGDYYLRPPTYLSGAATIDTSITGTYTGSTVIIAASTATIGHCFQSNGSTNTFFQPLSVFNSDSFRLANVVNNSFWRSNSNAFNTTIYMSCSLRYPINEWSD